MPADVFRVRQRRLLRALQIFMRAGLPNAWSFDLHRCGKRARERVLIHSVQVWGGARPFVPAPVSTQPIPSPCPAPRALTVIPPSVACAEKKVKNAADMRVYGLGGRLDVARTVRQSVRSGDLRSCPTGRKPLVSGPVRGENVENLLTFSNECPKFKAALVQK